MEVCDWTSEAAASAGRGLLGPGLHARKFGGPQPPIAGLRQQLLAGEVREAAGRRGRIRRSGRVGGPTLHHVAGREKDDEPSCDHAAAGPGNRNSTLG